MSLKFTATKAEHKLILEITKRVLKVSADVEIHYAKVDIIMDIEVCHCNGARLDLKRLLGFDAFNFAHDVFGIRRHLDRETGKLNDCFLPRCASKTERKNP